MGQLTKTAVFDYGQIEDKDVRGKLVYFANALNKRSVKEISLFLDDGADLIVAQEVLANHKNGIFEGWIAAECPFSKSTAYKMMSVSRAFGGVNISSSGWAISVSTMYLLASEKCPEKATEQALKLLESGKPVPLKLAKELITKNTISAESSPQHPSSADSPDIADPPQVAQPAIEPEAAEEEKHPEPWEEFAAEHEAALKHLTAAIMCVNRIEKHGEQAAYLAPVITRIRTDYKALRGTIASNCPVGMKGEAIQTKVMERKP